MSPATKVSSALKMGPEVILFNKIILLIILYII